jgi:heat shock protein HtpX
VVSIVLQIALGFLALIVVGWFSRRREFEADRFSAKAYGPSPMVSALRSISRFAEEAEKQNALADPLATMKISGDTGKWMHVFATHPPIEERIAALQRFA